MHKDWNAEITHRKQQVSFKQYKVELFTMKILITLATVLFALTLNAQEISGTYYEGPDSISFNDNNIEFSVRGNDGLGVVFTAQGTYEIIDDFMLVKTEKYSGAKTKIETAAAEKNDTIQLQLFNEDGFSISGIRAEFLNKKGNPIALSISNDHGKILHRIDPKITAIKVSDLLYDKTTFDFEKGTDYTVYLVKNRVLEDKIVIFKLEDITDTKLTMKLLSTDFNRSNPSASHLKKLDKKNAAIIDRTRLFAKPEY